MNSKAIAILEDIEYATIATCDNNANPWNSPVFSAHDEDFNIYWSSHPGSVHSMNIASNGKAFIAVYNSKAKTGEGVGLYIQAKASALNDEEEIQRGLELLGKRRGSPFKNIQKFMNDGPQRIYKATPLQIWINDADQDSNGDFIRDFRIKV